MRTLTLFLFVLLSTSLTFAMPAQILLLRHAEKPDSDSPELSTRGWMRAQALPRLFHDRPELLRFGPPVALFAMAPKKKDGSVRAIQTLKYVADDLKLPINADYAKKQFDQMDQAIRRNRSLDGKMIVICWEHDYLTDIAQDLGLTDAPKWAGSQFDRIWSLTFKGSTLQFKNLPQNLLPDDSTD